jgi:hypothetical protein
VNVGKTPRCVCPYFQRPHARRREVLTGGVGFKDSRAYDMLRERARDCREREGVYNSGRT